MAATPVSERMAPSRQHRLFVFLSSACLFLALFAGLIGQSFAVTTLGTDQHKRVLGAAEVDWLRDPTGALTIEQIVTQPHQAQFQPLTKGLNFGFTRDAIWLRITLARSADAPRDWRLELTVPYMTSIDRSKLEFASLDPNLPQRRSPRPMLEYEAPVGAHTRAAVLQSKAEAPLPAALDNLLDMIQPLEENEFLPCRKRRASEQPDAD
jgi:hypothetical protein